MSKKPTEESEEKELSSMLVRAQQSGLLKKQQKVYTAYKDFVCDMLEELDERVEKKRSASGHMSITIVWNKRRFHAYPKKETLTSISDLKKLCSNSVAHPPEENFDLVHVIDSQRKSFIITPEDLTEFLKFQTSTVLLFVKGQPAVTPSQTMLLEQDIFRSRAIGFVDNNGDKSQIASYRDLAVLFLRKNCATAPLTQ